jgi:hypothetical protein
VSNEQKLEQEIQEKGLNAPRLTPDLIDGVILQERYWQPEGTTLTVCALELKNGTQVTGESACVSAANFDVEIGKKIAYQNAREKIWALEGYLLKQSLHEGARKQTGFPIPETIGVVKTAADSVSDLG